MSDDVVRAIEKLALITAAAARASIEASAMIQDNFEHAKAGRPIPNSGPQVRALIDLYDLSDNAVAYMFRSLYN